MNNGEYIFNGEYVDSKGNLHYKVSQKPEIKACPKCGSRDFIINEYTHKKVTDIDKDGNKVIFDVTQPRYRCRSCRKTFMIPIEGRRGAFTENLIGYVFEEHTEKNRPVKDISEELQIPFSTVRKIITGEMDRRRSMQAYTLPWRIYLDRLYLKGRDVFLIFDMQEMSLLDILDEKDLASRGDTANVKEVFIRGDSGQIAELFPEAQIHEYRPEILQAGYRVLEREAQAEKIDLDLLRHCLLEGEEDLLGELAGQSIKIIPIKLAYDFLNENKNNPVKLREYDGELKDFKAFTQSIKDFELPEGFFPETFERFCRSVETFGEEVRAHNRRRNGYDSARDLILFSGNPTYPDGLGEKEKDRNFGKKLPVL